MIAVSPPLASLCKPAAAPSAAGRFLRGAATGVYRLLAGASTAGTDVTGVYCLLADASTAASDVTGLTGDCFIATRSWLPCDDVTELQCDCDLTTLTSAAGREKFSQLLSWSLECSLS